MKDVNNYKLMFKGLSAGKHKFIFELKDSFFSLFESSEIECGNLLAEVELEKQTALLQIDIKITGSIKTECDRCLEELDFPVFYTGRLLVKFSKTQGEANADNDDVIILDPSEYEVDLSQFLFDSIHVSLPIKKVHIDGQCNKEMIEKINKLKVEKLIS